MTALPDVDVLIALAWPNRVRHAAASAWPADRRRQARATRPLTESGFVRVSCGPPAVGLTFAALEATAIFERFSGLGSRAFRALERSIFPLPGSQGCRQVCGRVVLAAATQRR